ncbi:relaxase/mobilization nuclease domain-containing protein [Vagococcus lutrae]|uniref:relaxase/mobilization nuclease domain-containing protein n=1 Tax=Vagococcus lutrae TaxID=81947 RepID=UPI0019278C16|nr:relaxase/mobilization nuclease domain-containing protein [Vagococcus lutrae]UQF11456.1 relaxase/mobilization nuclease domain-containing protein [Vagococcus lutrae]UQF71635.1 relaxase/mobilization nuclease domain-containing protein [Vagococcus lutrae]GEQ61661.1 relaxase/mobilization nuclease domain protein [Vagococcus lutrae]GEQ63210.1 relaxase/mobilization nuclease domain protein [Vagococcus lutrae]GEQ65102.1 relaxase/mobilization nuclease domain protein [Vagococcus lutrae]
MAITKIHPIKSTLKLAIDYITRDEKTDNQILVSGYKCNPVTAHTSFLKTREDNNIQGKVLAQHLIQSFYPGETDVETAHRIGQKLCERHLKNEYEYVIATHIDRGHIHNHIIFNHVNMKTGKCYRSNHKTYHKIRNRSDKLCRENNLSVIDPYYESYKRKYKTTGKSWYEYQHVKKGTSWKSKLQFDIDRTLKQAKDWENFLRRMVELGYEVKYGKHIAFRHKNKQRFTRSKTIGDDYTEERLKERLTENLQFDYSRVKKRVGYVIDINNNKKIKSSKGYEFWAKKHNLKTMADSVIAIRELGINSKQDLEAYIRNSADERQKTLDIIQDIESTIEKLSETMEQVEIIRKHREHYKYHKANPNDENFSREYSAELKLYIVASKAIMKTYDTVPKSKDILNQLDKLQEKKNTLMKEYFKFNNLFTELIQYKKNYESYMDKEVER